VTDGAADDGAFRARLAAAAAGERAAQDALVGEFYDRVSAVVHRQLQLDFRKRHPWILPLFSTRDVVQDVMTDVLRRLDSTDFPDPDAFVAYLATMVRNHLLGAVRYHEAQRRDNRRNRDVDVEAGNEPAADEVPPAVAAALGEQIGIVRAAIEALPDRPRALVEMRLLQEQPFADIAQALGYASADAARNAFHDAHARLLVKLRAKGIRPDATQGG
jgi:RNA polymerase sigma factor (sigma-70 family)